MTGGVQLQSTAAVLNFPGCRTEVPAGKKFRGEYGTHILAERKCPSCGSNAEPNVKFCGECGTRT